MVASVDSIAKSAQAWFPDTSQFVIFDAGLSILASHDCSPTTQDLASLRDAFESRDQAVQRGVYLGGQRFEVHRHHPPLLYGRQMAGGIDPEEGLGIAVFRVENSVLGSTCHMAITYRLPNTSAHIATLLRNFCEKNIDGAAAAAAAPN